MTVRIGSQRNDLMPSRLECRRQMHKLTGKILMDEKDALALNRTHASAGVCDRHSVVELHSHCKPAPAPIPRPAVPLRKQLN